MRADEILSRVSYALKVLAYFCGFFLLICISPHSNHTQYLPWLIAGLVLLIAGAIVTEEISLRSWRASGPASYHAPRAHPGIMREISPRDMGSDGEWDEEWDYQRPVANCAYIVLVGGVMLAWSARPYLLHEYRFAWAGFIAAWVLTVLLFVGVVWLLGRLNIKLAMELTDPQPMRIWAAVRSACAWIAGMCTLAILTWLISCGGDAIPYVNQALPVLGIALGGIALSSCFIR